MRMTWAGGFVGERYVKLAANIKAQRESWYYGSDDCGVI